MSSKSSLEDGGNTRPSRRSRHRSQRTWSRALFSNVLRLSVWFSIITVLFRCPTSSEELSLDSPRICKPYLQARDFITPHVQPYYDTYAAPYVDRARPYADRFNNQVYQPSYQFASKNYQRYGAPRVEQARVVSLQQWEQTIRPQLENGRVKAVDVYSTSLGPHVDKVTAALSPYYEKARATAETQYVTIFLPTYEKARPYAIDAYERGSHFTTEVGIPYTQWAAANAATFIQRRVWPPIRIIYGENVQPQLTKISERLSNYREGKAIESAAEAEEQSISSSSSSSSSSASEISAAASSETSPGTTSMSTEKPAASISSPTRPVTTKAPENILDDLTVWKKKFNRAAEEGAVGLQERIDEIAETQVNEQCQGTGEALVTSLEETARSAISTLKSDILSIIASLPSDGADDHEGTPSKSKAKARDAVRAAGKKVRDHAQQLRSWRQLYNEDTQKMIDSAADSTLDVVDSIREAGLQEIGMRWAGMDGVTYKDWSEYHAMRKSFDEWRNTLQDVVDKHEAPAKARKAAEEIESRGMAVAEDAAKELSRLKDVANWKIEARDDSEDFSTRYTPPGAARAAQKAKDKVEEAVQGETSQGTAESITSRVGEAASSVANQASSGASSAKKSASSAISPAVDSAGSASSKASQATDSLGSSASSASSSASSDASSATDSLSSSASKSSSSASSRASSAASSANSPISSSASDASSSASSAASSASARAASSASSASREGITPESAIPANAEYGRRKIAADSAAQAARDASSSASSAAASGSDEGTSAASGVADSAKRAASDASYKAAHAASEAAAKAAGASDAVRSGSSSVAGTTVPGSDGSDSVSVPISEASKRAKSKVESSVDAAEKMRKSAGGERESPVESLRQSVSQADEL